MVFPDRVYNTNERKIIMDKEHLEKQVNLGKEIGYGIERKND